MKRNSNTAARIAQIFKDHFAILIFIGIFTFIAHFLLIGDYGIYFDDYYSLGFSAKSEVFKFWEDGALSGSIGRPLYFWVRSLFFNLLNVPQVGLLGMYFLVYLLWVSLAAAFYFFFEKRVSQEFALIGAIFLVVFPAFTCQQYLTNALYQIGLLGVLLAWQLYSTGKARYIVLSYLMFLCLLLYLELHAVLFYAAPSLSEKKHPGFKKLVVHAAILTAIVGGLILYRRYVAADVRMAGGTGELQEGIMMYLSPGFIEKILIGLRASTGMFVKAPYYSIVKWKTEMTFIVLGSFPLLVFFLGSFLLSPSGIAVAEDVRPIRVGGKSISIDRYSRRLLEYGGIGVTLAFLGYFLTPFMHMSASTVRGAASRVHEAAMIGVCCLLSSLICLLLRYSKGRPIRAALVMAFSAYLCLVLSYRYLIQYDYRESWQMHKTFWTKTVKLIPDLEQKTVVVVDSRNFPRTYFVNWYYRPISVLLPRVLEFPKSWGREESPRLFVAHRELGDLLKFEDGRFLFNTEMVGWIALEDGNVVILERRKRGLKRRFSPIEVDGRQLDMKPLNRRGRSTKPGYFYNYIVYDERRYF